jgi:GDP-L-fucose synthase
MQRIHDAKTHDAPEVIIWGSGKPRREFLHADDLANAVVFLLEHYDSPETINVGFGSDVSIRELAEILADTIGYHGELRQDTTKPDGTPQKLLDVTKLTNLGWKARIPLAEGLKDTYTWFLAHQGKLRSK